MKEIIIFSDFACPFCYIGFSIMEKFHKETEQVSFKFLPIELNPKESLLGSDLGDHISESEINKSYERIEALGREYGLVYKNKRRRFNTRRLHLASQYAQEKEKMFEFSKLAFKYIFEYGINIGKKENIDEIAKVIGLNIYEMNEKIDRGDYDYIIDRSKDLALEYEVESVPTFIVDGKKKPTYLKTYNEFLNDILK